MQRIEWSFWNVYVGGSPLHDEDKWIFERPAYTDFDKAKVEAEKAECDEMDAKFPLGNGDRRYKSERVIKSRTVDIGEWS